MIVYFAKLFANLVLVKTESKSIQNFVRKIRKFVCNMKNLLFYSILIAVLILNFGCKSAETLEIKMTNSNSKMVENVNKVSAPNDKNESKIINLETSYKNYFENNAKCNKPDNKNGSKDSPCLINITFNSNGEANKTISFSKSNSDSDNAHQTLVGKISNEQFSKMYLNISENEMFKDLKNVDLTVSNSKITLVNGNEIKEVMSNVDEKTTTFLSMLNEIQKIDKEIIWKEEKNN